MKNKITIELNMNEQIAVENWSRGLGNLEHHYFWLGLMLKHNVAANMVDLETLVVDGNLVTVEYYAKNKSHLI